MCPVHSGKLSEICISRINLALSRKKPFAFFCMGEGEGEEHSPSTASALLKILNLIIDYQSKCSFKCVLEARAYTTVEAMLIRIHVERLYGRKKIAR